MNLKDYKLYKELSLYGRHIAFDSLQPLLNNLNFENTTIGYSYLNKPIHKIKLGTGKTKVLIWTQMHGNESTGTKAIFDLLNFFDKPLKKVNLRDRILNECTIIIVPMLNPDGAEKYTRVNAQNIDLNRDAVDLKAPESKLLNSLIIKFKPSYCFNLHDQRPIFSVGKKNLSATLSFLAPSEDVDRKLTSGRIKSMKVIVAMNNMLQKYIPNQIGRYTDEFYPTATGDNFQKAGFNTVLIEAGHYKYDYQREKTRGFNFLALIFGLESIANDTKRVDYKDYFKIPNNEKKYFEYLLNNSVLKLKKIKIGVYLEDKLVDGKIVFTKNYQVLPFKTPIYSNKIIHKRLVFSEEEDIVFYINNKL